jgi:hypothetical protein
MPWWWLGRAHHIPMQQFMDACPCLSPYVSAHLNSHRQLNHNRIILSSCRVCRHRHWPVAEGLLTPTHHTPQTAHTTFQCTYHATHQAHPYLTEYHQQLQPSSCSPPLGVYTLHSVVCHPQAPGLRPGRAPS